MGNKGNVKNGLVFEELFEPEKTKLYTYHPGDSNENVLIAEAYPGFKVIINQAGEINFESDGIAKQLYDIKDDQEVEQIKSRMNLNEKMLEGTGCNYCLEKDLSLDDFKMYGIAKHEFILVTDVDKDTTVHFNFVGKPHSHMDKPFTINKGEKLFFQLTGSHKHKRGSNFFGLWSDHFHKEYKEVDINTVVNHTKQNIHLKDMVENMGLLDWFKKEII